MKIFLTALFSVVMFNACSQTAGKALLYGYKEPVISGVSPQVTLEEGSSDMRVQKGRTSFNYFVYLVAPGSRIYPSEIWLMGKPYSASVQIIDSTPVVRDNGSNPINEEKPVLVPKTTDKVIQLQPLPPVESKHSSKGRSLAAQNELVVVYKQNGKWYYKTMKEMKPLGAVATQ